MRGRFAKHPRQSKATRAWADQRRAWGISERGGQRVFLKDLVEDGQYPGLLVTRAEKDYRHPQEYAVNSADAVALERPSPERDTPAVYAQIPGVHSDKISQRQWLGSFRAELGQITASPFTSSSRQAQGNEAVAEVGSITAQIAVGAVNAQLSGIEAGADVGAVLAANTQEASALSTGAQAQVGNLTVALGVNASVTGLAVGAQVGGLSVVGSVWTQSFFTTQFLGITPRARDQLQ